MNKTESMKWDKLEGKTIREVAMYATYIVLYFTDDTEAVIYKNLEIEPPEEQRKTR